MQLLDISFRDLNQKWIVIERWKDIKRLMKNLDIDLEDAIVLAYLYIDHEKGICARVLGNISFENHQLLLNDSFLEKDYIIEHDLLKKIKFEIVDDETKSKIKNIDVIESNILEKYYNKPSILESRELTDIDEFRHEFFPDDLELYFEKNKKSELIWGRIEVFSKEKEILACKLLNDSNIDEQYKKDVYVFVKIVRNKKDIDVVIDTIANIKSR